MITRLATFNGRLAILFAFLIGLAACGGGGGGDGDNSGGFLPDDSSDNIYYVDVVLLDALGEPTNTVTTTRPNRLEVTVTKKNKNGAPIADVIVTVASTIADIDPDQGSGLTNADGVATFRVQSTGTLGAGTITASVDNAPAGTETASINIQVVKANLRLGYFEGTDFIDGMIDVQPKETLSPGGTAYLTFSVVDEFGALAVTDEQVKLASQCIGGNFATLNPANPISITGQATVAYTANGCEGDDIITGTLVDTPSQATATVSIAPLSSTAEKVVPVSADPPVIVLKGTGDGVIRKETTTLKFRVTDASGRPIPNVDVAFDLSTRVGGLALGDTEDTSDINGNVTTTVTSGDAPTRFLVFATLVDSGISNTSEPLAVSTGVPEQRGISLSISGGGNVIENGFNEEGVERLITVRMLDKFGAPAPNGTRALFDAEYGEVDLSCVLGVANGGGVSAGTPDTGECTVLWTSERPQPGDPDLVKTINDGANCSSHNGTGPCPEDLGSLRGGRSTVSVRAEGDEWFNDANENNQYDEGEEFENLPEAFTDYNEDSLYTPAYSNPDCGSATSLADCKAAGADEPFFDLNNNGIYNKFNNPAQYNGILCPPEGDKVFCSRSPVDVRADAVLVLSDATSWDAALADVAARTKVGSTTWGRNYMVYISDQYNNPPPAGSRITVTPSGDCELLSPSTFEVPNKVTPGAFGFELKTDGEGELSDVRVSMNSSDGSSFSRTFGCKVRIPPDPNERL
jgi:hypothetical protein